MIRKCLVSFLFLSLVLSVSVFAQEDDLQSTVDYKVHKMQKELTLTDGQVEAIEPVVKDYMSKREEILQGISGQGIVDHVAVKGTLKALKETEYQKLGKILNEDQMKNWVNKENVMATLNPDSPESRVDDGASLNGNGVDMKF